MQKKSQIMLDNMQIVLYHINMNSNRYNADGEYGKRGYLKENYRVFNIKDKKKEEFEFHYHEFNKLIFFISGNVEYIVEGKAYKLKPYDILLVRQGDIHKPVIDSNAVYDRVIIWINSNYLNSIHNLSDCFNNDDKRHFNLIRTDSQCSKRIFELLRMLVNNNSSEFEGEFMSDLLFYQIMILVNRCMLYNKRINYSYKSDERIDNIIEYINKNLLENITLDDISKKFFISRYYLMHKFKQATGKTVYSYIQTKRLLYAAQLLNNGETAQNACFQSGYNDYSVFLKAFKKEFDLTPTEYKKSNGLI